MTDEAEAAEEAEDEAVPAAEDTDLADRPAGAYAAQRVREIRRDARRSPMAWLSDVRSGERAWRAAQRAEVEVGRQLRKLGPGWFVLHSVPLGPRGFAAEPSDHDAEVLTLHDLDHLVIGPAGVLALTTFGAGSDVVSVEGDLVRRNRRDVDLHEARAVARLASERLSDAAGAPVEVQPVLVVLAGRLHVVEESAEMPVVARRAIAAWLMRRPSVQVFERTKELYGLARMARIWRDEAG